MSSEATAGQTPDIFGQLHPVETPELLERKRKEFEEEIEKIPDEDKSSLLTAQTKCPELLTDDFKLMFLRCEVFNSDLAAKRYARYWDQRVERFGPEKAFQPLTLEKDDEVCFSFGWLRLLPTKAEKGRSILYFDPSKHDKTKYAHDNMARVLWYMMHAALEDNELAQKHGIIVIGHPQHSKFGNFDPSFNKMFLKSVQGVLPIRLSAILVCHPPFFLPIIYNLVKLFMSDRIKKRYRVYSGSTEKVLKGLNKLGLDKSRLPTEIGGTIQLDHETWYQKRKEAGL